MLTRFVRTQLIIFTIAIVVLPAEPFDKEQYQTLARPVRALVR